MGFKPLSRRLAVGAALGSLAALGTTLAGTAGLTLLGSPPAARAQGTPGLLEFRWENNRDYRKLYFWMSNTQRLKRSDYYLMLRPKDRKTAILKLTVTIPPHFDSKIDPSRVRLCKMNKGGMLSRTRCTETIPATIEIAENGGAIEIFPDTPVGDQDTIGVAMSLFNPYNVGMYQFNAQAQAPGEVPISGYLGSWLIQIDPTSN
jgi:hypothetical protein